jgi:hypothetical protein
MNQTFQRMANVGLWSARFQLIKQGQHLETTLVFTPLFSIYLHHPCVCSIIPCIGLSSPRAPKQRKVGKFECRWQRIRLHTKRHVCPPPWLPWTTATSSTCVPIVWAWGPRPSPTWSTLSPCTLTMRFGGLCLSWTWATLHPGMCLPLRGRPAQW